MRYVLVSLNRKRTSFFLVLLFALAVLLAGQPADAQRLSYSSGQNISPGYEGWEEDPDGSRWFVFGYMNRNWEDEPDIPVGPENSISPGGPDLGQPTHFLPRRNRFVFRVPVPDDFSDDDEMVWTLSVNGVTEQAFATLRPDYYMDSMIRMSEGGAIGAGTSNPTIRANTAPVAMVKGADTRSVRVGEPLMLVATATDDGVPETPRARRERQANRADGRGRRFNKWSPHYRGTVSTETGLRVSWFVYRGTGDVTFNPPQVKVWEDTRTGANSPWGPHFILSDPPEDDTWTTNVTFDTPGTYVLRCRTSDGALDVDHDVTVTVMP
jgi:hypothetical protein